MRHIGQMLSSLGNAVRRNDPDRFFCALLAPAARREPLFTLLAFNHELARAQAAAREPGLALIRLQWWREVVEGAAKRHEVATPLLAAIQAGTLPRAELLGMVDAREAEIEGTAGLVEWRDVLLQGPGSLAVAAGMALGVEPSFLPRLRRLGAGYGVAGRLRNCALGHNGGVAMLPAALPPGAELSTIIAALVPLGLELLGSPARLPRHAAGAALPAVFARLDLARLPHALPRRGVSDRLAVLWAATCRCA